MTPPTTIETIDAPGRSSHRRVADAVQTWSATSGCDGLKGDRVQKLTSSLLVMR